MGGEGDDCSQEKEELHLILISKRKRYAKICLFT